MKPDESKPVFLYLATNHEGILKIGISNNPIRRHLTIDGLFKLGQCVHILRICEGSRETEKQAHARFAHLRISKGKHTEWYRESAEIIEYFQSLPDLTDAAKLAVIASNNRITKLRHAKAKAARAKARYHRC